MPPLFRCLRNPLFARLYCAQTINLIGDALTWLGLALLAFEVGGDNAGVILSTALTIRVTAYVILSPLAGSIADRVDRKRIMVVTHLARMVIVCLLPFVSQPWQIYAIVLALNVFSAFFTPTYTATIPLVATQYFRLNQGQAHPKVDKWHWKERSLEDTRLAWRPAESWRYRWE